MTEIDEVTQVELYEKLQSSGVVPTDGLQKLSADDAPELIVAVPAETLQGFGAYLASDEGLHFNSLMCLTAIDLGEELQVVYHLFSIKHRHKLTVKVNAPKDNPKVPTVEGIWPTAGWHEREAFDLVGVEFEGHADLRRILLPEDWEGHPLRVDYEFPKEYRGIPM